jgi:hypothetical protein
VDSSIVVGRGLDYTTFGNDKRKIVRRRLLFAVVVDAVWCGSDMAPAAKESKEGTNKNN